ncbi:MAG: DUF2225 domain-containing protein [Fusobacteria bacterium]|nr:DUF2225 domain-containing protein [Fusobacteriota bacterium]
MDENIFYEIELDCPVCNYKFTEYKTKVKVRENMPTGYESYLLPIYKNELNNPLSYEIDVCPNCNYAAYHGDFKENIDNKTITIAKTFFKEIKNLAKDVNYNISYRNYEKARISYILTAFILEQLKQKDHLKLAKSYIRVAWFSKEIRDISFYRKSLKKALDSYINAYNEIDDFKLSSIIVYLIGAIYIELGDFESAIPYFNKLNGDLKAKKISEIKDKLEELTLVVRENLKELNEKLKTLTDEEKKKYKLEMKEANKIPDYKKPFGIEIANPKLEEENYEIENTNIEKNKKNIFLIVDDSKLFVKTLEKIVESFSDKIYTASNGEEAIKIVKKEKIDIVTLDIEMPGINGIETLKKIKKLNKNIEVIMISSKQDSKTIVEALKLGAINYLLKPLDKDKLINIIKKC